MFRASVLAAALAAAAATPGSPSARPVQANEAFARAEVNGRRVEELLGRARRGLHAWLKHADARTLLLPDHLPVFRKGAPVYTPHNSGADNYPYLIATAWFTDRAAYDGRMREMLRNEIRVTNDERGLPRALDLSTGKLGEPYVFGAAEYAKDGLVSVTELLGRTPWFFRMVDMTAALMEHAPVASRFGALPDTGAEINGDLLQTLVRLAAMTGDRRFLEWAERIGDAYVEEILPANHGLPAYDWDFERHAGPDRLRLRDHGNEVIVGLVLLHALESALGRPRAASYRPVLARMIDRVLESANADGLFYNEVRCSDLEPLDRGISDNWGYIYGAVYTFYMVTGEAKYRESVVRVLRSLPKYRGFDWERGRQDGYADTIESALYLINREPVPEAIGWIESEMTTLLAFQQPDGLVEGAYPDGNWLRTVLLYALWKTQGAWLEPWQPGVRLGAARSGDTISITVESPTRWSGRLHFDRARHRRVMNLDRNYVRLNEWPEWFPLDENTLYDVRDGAGRTQVLLGSDLIDGVLVTTPARLEVRRASRGFPAPAPAAQIRWGAEVFRQRPEWYASAEARAIADSVLQYQSPQGGWPKNTNLAAPPRSPADVPPPDDGLANTIDNGATTTPMRFLALMVRATQEAKYRRSFERGMDYLLAAQYPNGGWPQFFPLRKGYYSRITYNDDAIANVLTLLRDAAAGTPPYGFVDDARRARARTAVERGVDIILRTQVRQHGRLTAWCAQHDERTLEPAWARSYEPPSLSGQETVGVVRFLMQIERPAPAVIAAVEGAVAWLESAAIRGLRLEAFTDAEGRPDRRVVADPAAAPLWARFYELGTNRPIFLGRDSVVRGRLDQIERERRAGYAYYGSWPASLLAEDFPRWRETHTRMPGQSPTTRQRETTIRP